MISIAFDSPDAQALAARELGIDRVPMLTDTDHSVAQAYDVLQWAVASGEPGHTFVLVKADGTIGWVRDYGAPQNGGTMYVPVADLAQQVRDHME